jgi:hypothetical protein
MTSCSCVVVRMKVNSGIGFGRFGRELELVLRVLAASPWMLERFLSTSRRGMVKTVTRIGVCDLRSKGVSAGPQEMSRQSVDGRFRLRRLLYGSHGQVKRAMLAMVVTCSKAALAAVLIRPSVSSILLLRLSCVFLKYTRPWNTLQHQAPEIFLAIPSWNIAQHSSLELDHDSLRCSSIIFFSITYPFLSRYHSSSLLD